MEIVQYVRKTDLARNTRQVIRDVLRGQTIVVENHGEPEVAIIDIADYHILRAVAHYQAQSLQIELGKGLTDEAVEQLSTPQEQYDLVIAQYLAGDISLGRAAELLKLPWIDLRTRLARLDVMMPMAPTNLDEARADVANAAAWLADERA
jgi:prevent-host-death family protein